MAIIRCKKVGSVKSITVGNEYKVISETDNRYTIVNDKGVQANYGKNLFDEVKGNRRPQVAPAAPAIVVVEELEIETTFEDFVHTVKATIAGQEFEYEFEEAMEANTSDISCGIEELTGVDNIVGEFNEFKREFGEFLQANRGVFTLHADINLQETYNEVAEALVQDLIADFQGEDGSGILIMSTTENSIDTCPELKAAFEACSDSVLSTRNPNTGNDIIMWSFIVNK